MPPKRKGGDNNTGVSKSKKSCEVHDIPLQKYWLRLKAMEPRYPDKFKELEAMISLFRHSQKLAKYFGRHYSSRFSYFHRFAEGLLLDEQGLYSVTPETFARHSARRCRGKVVLDLFAGVGGNAIAFALEGCYVICVEQDPMRVRMLIHNARIYGVENNIVVQQGDSLKFLKLLRCDVVFLSPPWGGPEYGEVVFDLQNAMFLNGVCLYRHCKAMTDNIIYYVPKRTPRPHLAALANQPACYCDGECLGKLSSGDQRHDFVKADPYRNFMQHSAHFDDWACTCEKQECTTTIEEYTQGVDHNVLIHTNPTCTSAYEACCAQNTTDREDTSKQSYFSKQSGVLQSKKGRVFIGHLSSQIQHSNRGLHNLARMLHEGTDCSGVTVERSMQREDFFGYIYGVLQGSTLGYVWEHNASQVIPQVTPPPAEALNFYWIAQRIMKTALQHFTQYPVLEKHVAALHLHERLYVHNLFLPTQSVSNTPASYVVSSPVITEDILTYKDSIIQLQDGYCDEYGHMVDQLQWDTVNTPIKNVLPSIQAPMQPQPVLVLQPQKQRQLPSFFLETSLPTDTSLAQVFPCILQQCDTQTSAKQHFQWKSSLDIGEIDAKADLLHSYFLADCMFNQTPLREVYDAMKLDQNSDLEIINMYADHFPALVHFSKTFFTQFISNMSGANKVLQLVSPSSYLFYQANLQNYIYTHKEEYALGNYTLTLPPPVSTPLVCHAHAHMPYSQLPPAMQQNVVEIQTMSLNGATKALSAYYGHDIQNKVP